LIFFLNENFQILIHCTWIYENNTDDTSDNYNEDCYDIDEVFSNRSEQIEGLNPGLNRLTASLSLLDRKTPDLPCSLVPREDTNQPYSLWSGGTINPVNPWGGW
jgi:hypothetical protein